MPMFTYAPKWDRIEEFFNRVSEALPENYTGFVGVRLHRTGNPLRLEILGSQIPDRELFPMAVIELKQGEPTRSWRDLEIDFDVPWVTQRDFDGYRNNVMAYYHMEDVLEPAAEKVLAGDPPSREEIRAVIYDHAGALAGA